MAAAPAAWGHHMEGGARGEAESLAAALSTRGFETRLARGLPGASAGVVLFDRFSDELCAAVGELSGAGAQRVLAAALERGSLDVGKCRGLLHCGARCDAISG